MELYNNNIKNKKINQIVYINDVIMSKNDDYNVLGILYEFIIQ